jgi:hypothetical protein
MADKARLSTSTVRTRFLFCWANPKEAAMSSLATSMTRTLPVGGSISKSTSSRLRYMSVRLFKASSPRCNNLRSIRPVTGRRRRLLAKVNEETP